MAGRRSVWAGVVGQELVLDVNAALAAMDRARRDRKAVRNAINQIRDRNSAWAKWDAETLRLNYYRARRHHGDSPPPLKQSPEDRWTFLLQKWDKSLSPVQARKEVTDAVAIADWRLKHFPEIFDVMERRTSWNGDPRRKANQIREWFRRMADDPRYCPRVKQPLPDRDGDRVRELLRDGPKNKSELAHAMGKTKPAISNIIQRTLNSGHIVRLAVGVFALPGMPPHVKTPDAILKLLTNAAGEVALAAICTGTGKPKTTISAALDHLIDAHLVVRVRRGVYALAVLGAVCHGWARDDVLALLKPVKWMSQAALVEATGRRPGAISSALQRLRSEGKIRRVAHGFYVLAIPRRRRSAVALRLRNQVIS